MEEGVNLDHPLARYNLQLRTASQLTRAATRAFGKANRGCLGKQTLVLSATESSQIASTENEPLHAGGPGFHPKRRKNKKHTKEHGHKR